VAPVVPILDDQATVSIKEIFLSKVVKQVVALLLAPTNSNKGARTLQPGSTPRHSRRVAGAGVEFLMGDMSRRSKKRVMRSLKIIGENEGVSQQAQGEYGKLFSEPLSMSNLHALAALFGWADLENWDSEGPNAALVL
jgi:hypothetical protein